MKSYDVTVNRSDVRSDALNDDSVTRDGVKGVSSNDGNVTRDDVRKDVLDDDDEGKDGDDDDTPFTLNSSPMRNTNDVTSRLPCCRAYMTLPLPQGLYIACSTWAQLDTSTASVTWYKK